ncbi:MAG TPA: protein-L-isoaspartate(D-aspartate) O-methyltransferase [Flavobacteriales bacterium]|nr:protein-L-isoaspartate(D-aspartate) O-methyltransferase [Flavobacteriales bacterium]
MIPRFIILALSTLLTFSSGAQHSYEEEPWKALAATMVAKQITDRGVKDQRIIEVMKNTPRHLFIAPEFTEQAYGDHPLPITEGQTISQPYIVALMTELLDLTQTDKVLEIGTGSGYQAAVLSQLVNSVFSIEVVASLARGAKERLKILGYNNVIVKHGDGYKGWPEHAPFDKIIVTAAPPEIPSELINQLNDPGIMVLPVGTYSQELVVITKKGGNVNKEVIIPVRFVPMVHEKDE